MILRIFSIFLSISVLFFSCKKQNSVTLVKETIDGIKVEYQFDTINKTKQGYFKSFHPNGKIASEKNYCNDTLDGSEKLYYPSGNLYGEFILKKGSYEGNFKYYFEDKKIMQEGMYESNAIKGELKTYYKNGKLKEIVTMENNEEKGPFTEYYDNGNLKAKGNYFGGPNSEDCLLEIYNENVNEQLDLKKYCQNGICCDFWSKEKGDLKPSSSLCAKVIEEMQSKCK
jgi:antitoxin component YwqK of YwqJK toxin-antitoxin module